LEATEMKKIWNEMSAEQRAELIKGVYGEYAWSNYYETNFDGLNLFLQRVLERLENVLAI
jgi:hypothetical protein